MINYPCPACNKKVAVGATKCPHCLTEYSPEQLAERKDGAKVGIIGFALLLLAVFVGVWACSGDDEPVLVAEPAATASPEETEADLAAARAKAEAAWPPQALPAGVPDAPVAGFCLSSLCETEKVQFANSDWPRAWAGDYEGQRNVGYCLHDGCHGAVMQNDMDACAWRAIVIESHVDEVDSTDTRNLEIACGDLSETERRTAIAKAASIMERMR